MDYHVNDRSCLRSAEQDADYTERCYFAQQEADLALVEELPTLTTTNVEQYMVETALAAGWEGLTEIDVRFDIADDDPMAARCKGNLGSGEFSLHFHPSLLNACTALHELAHLLRPNDSHGPQFCAILVVLYRHGIGLSAALELAHAFKDVEMPLDYSWIEGSGLRDFDDGPTIEESLKSEFMEPSAVCAKYQTKPVG